jgi:hypothetical protein
LLALQLREWKISEHTQLVPNSNSISRRLSDSGPAVELLRVGEDLSVVTEERVEGAEGSPASAERLGDIAAESADISADDGNLIERCELQDLADGLAVPEPARDVIWILLVSSYTLPLDIEK